MLVLPELLSHQPPSPHPLLCLKRGSGIARGHPELGTHVALGQAGLPREALLLGHNQYQAALG